MVSLVAALVVVSVFAPAGTLTATAQSQQGGQSAGFVVESLEAPGAVSPGSTLTATATVLNPTDERRTEVVTFRLSGNGEDIVIHRRVTLGPNERTTLEFRIDTTGFDTGDDFLGVTTATDSELARLDVSRHALVEIGGHETNGTAVTVDSVFLPEGGYVTLHDRPAVRGNAVGSVVGVSGYLQPGYHENVTVSLFDVPGATFDRNRLTRNQRLWAVPHRETTGDRTFDFVSSNSTADGAYTRAGTPVTDWGPIVVDSNATVGG